MEPNPWAFGWDQTLAAVTILVGIANVGVLIFGILSAKKGFEDWQGERAAARRVELAEEALSKAYKVCAALLRLRSKETKDTVLVFDTSAAGSWTPSKIALEECKFYREFKKRLDEEMSEYEPLIPTIRAVFGHKTAHYAGLLVNAHTRIESSLMMIEKVAEMNEWREDADNSVSGTLGNSAFPPERIKKFWAVLFDEEDDTSEMAKQINAGYKHLEEKLAPIIRREIDED